MRRLIFIIVVFLLACSQETDRQRYQKMVLTDIIKDRQLNTFFENKNPILLEDNIYCNWEVGTLINLGKIKIKIIFPNSIKYQKALRFIKYQVSDKIINVEMLLFRKNVLLQAKYKKQKNGITKLSSNVTFSKKQLDTD